MCKNQKWDANFRDGKIRIIQRGETLAEFIPENTSGLRAFCRCNNIGEVILPTNLPDELREIIRFALEPTPNTGKLGSAPHIEPMVEIDFWSLVERVRWWSDHDYNQGKQRLLRHLCTAERCQAFRETYDYMRHAVSEAIAEYETEHNINIAVGGDSYEDLVAHIVGLGQVGYKNALRNPSTIFHKAETGDYVESFSYCVPFPDDLLVSAWRDSDRRRHRDRQVERCVQDIRDSVETLLSTHLDEHPALYHSPLAYEIELKVTAVVKQLLEKAS